MDIDCAYAAAKAETAGIDWRSARHICLDVFRRFRLSPKIAERLNYWQICGYKPGDGSYKGCVCVGTGNSLEAAWSNLLLVLMFTFSASCVAELRIKLDMRYLPKIFAHHSVEYSA